MEPSCEHGFGTKPSITPFQHYVHHWLMLLGFLWLARAVARHVSCMSLGIVASTSTAADR